MTTSTSVVAGVSTMPSGFDNTDVFVSVDNIAQFTCTLPSHRVVSTSSRRGRYPLLSIVIGEPSPKIGEMRQLACNSPDSNLE